jgi:hypothetical protein
MLLTPPTEPKDTVLASVSQFYPSLIYEHNAGAYPNIVTRDSTLIGRLLALARGGSRVVDHLTTYHEF